MPKLKGHALNGHIKFLQMEIYKSTVLCVILISVKNRGACHIHLFIQLICLSNGGGNDSMWCSRVLE